MLTRREEMIKLLKRTPMSIGELAEYFNVSYSTIAGKNQDLDSIRKTIRKDGLRIVVKPAQCNRCNFVFRDRGRVDDPKKCPKCHSEQIEPQRFMIE